MEKAALPSIGSEHTPKTLVSSGESRTSSARQQLIGGSVLPKLLPGIGGALLYVVNNLGTLHATLAVPPGYVPFGITRDSDVAQYLTWINGLRHGWLLPNYHAPWTTASGLFVPGLYPVAALTRLLPISTVTAFQLFNLAAYICLAYALAFAYRTFCETRSEKILAFVIALSCVPIAALPGMASLLSVLPLGPAVFGSTAGVSEFSLVSDGFLHGLSTWPLIAFGTCLTVLGMSLLARYCVSQARRWIRLLAVVCFVASVIHPFEIFVLVAVSVILFIRLGGGLRQTLARALFVFIPAAAGFLPYVIEARRFDWVHQVSLANCSLPLVMPARVLAAIGIPAIVALLLLFLGHPRSSSHHTLVLKIWFIATFVLLYVPGLPFPLHMLDGIFFCIGLLLVAQLKELATARRLPSKAAAYAIASVLLAWMLFPHIELRARAWPDAANPDSNGVTTFPAAIAPIDEPLAIGWLRANASPDDLVLATEEEAPWIATVPIHSFASHWLFSSEATRPGDMVVREKFFRGELAPPVAERFLEILGVRFVIVPDGSGAVRYLQPANLRARLKSWSIYEIPGQEMKRYRDPRIIDLGSGTLR